MLITLYCVSYKMASVTSCTMNRLKRTISRISMLRKENRKRRNSTRPYVPQHESGLIIKENQPLVGMMH